MTKCPYCFELGPHDFPDPFSPAWKKARQDHLTGPSPLLTEEYFFHARPLHIHQQKVRAGIHHTPKSAATRIRSCRINRSLRLFFEATRKARGTASIARRDFAPSEALAMSKNPVPCRRSIHYEIRAGVEEFGERERAALRRGMKSGTETIPGSILREIFSLATDIIVGISGSSATSHFDLERPYLQTRSGDVLPLLIRYGILGMALPSRIRPQPFLNRGKGFLSVKSIIKGRFGPDPDKPAFGEMFRVVISLSSYTQSIMLHIVMFLVHVYKNKIPA